jgi:hypothetical protein
MHHVEYLVVRGASEKRAFDEALAALQYAGYRLAQPHQARRAAFLDVWHWPEGPGARLRLPRGFDLGDEVAARLAHGLEAPVLRLFASAGREWGFDTFAPGGELTSTFRSDKPRRGDEAARLALWAGLGREAAQQMAQIVDPAQGAEGPEALVELARRVGAPYPDADREPPALRAMFFREEPAK